MENSVQNLHARYRAAFDKFNRSGFEDDSPEKKALSDKFNGLMSRIIATPSVTAEDVLAKLDFIESNTVTEGLVFDQEDMKKLLDDVRAAFQRAVAAGGVS